MTIVAHIVGLVSDISIDAHTIQKLLSTEEESLSHGNEFTGKPTTILHVNNAFVLKGKRGLIFSSFEIAQSWANKQLEKEKKFCLYLPLKTWFVVGSDEAWAVYNISPRLKPIHLAIESPDINTKEGVAYLSKITDIYLMHASQHDERLDEGLSNFGIDDKGNIYYLDDDFYTWDYILSFTNMIALWLRKFSSQWLDNEAAISFGETLQLQIHHHFHHHKGVDYLGVLDEQLNSLFMNDVASERAKLICSALRRKNKAHIKTHDSPAETKSSTTLTSSDTLQQRLKTWLTEDEPIAVLADVHANLPALDAVLDDIKQQQITRIVCLGDIIGYGPHPKECIRRMQALDILIIRGNHDHMAAEDNVIDNMSKSGAFMAHWTAKQLNSEEREWLSTLPLQLRTDDWILVHGAPRDTTFFNAYVYDRTSDSNLEWMQEKGFKYCFHGHSHLQGMYQMRAHQSSHYKNLETYPLQENNVHLICSGSVGQPRSGNPGAEYLVYDPKGQSVTFKRINYDITAVTQDMRKHGFPDHLMTRLENGF